MSKRCYTFNFDYFKIPNLNNSYWAGFIAGDGNLYIQNKCSYLAIRLKATDGEYILPQFQEDTEFTGKIYHLKPKKASPQTYIRICGCSQWHRDLRENFKITPRKTYTLEPPINLSYVNSLAFIKGLLDSDGQINIYQNYNRCKFSWRLRTGFSGTEKIIVWVQQTLSNEISSIGKLKLRTNGHIKELIFEGETAYKIAKLLNSLPTRSIERKYHNADLWLKEFQAYYSAPERSPIQKRRVNKDLMLIKP